MKARRRLRKERCFRLPLARQSQILEVRPRQRRVFSANSPASSKDPPDEPSSRPRSVRAPLQCAPKLCPVPAPALRAHPESPARREATRKRCGRRPPPERRTPTRKNSRARVAHRLLHRFRRSRNAFPESRALIEPNSSSVTGVSVSGSSSASSTGFDDRWLAGSNFRIDSISSPKNSTRTGRSDSGEYTSRMPPRAAYCPGISTTSVEL